MYATNQFNIFGMNYDGSVTVGEGLGRVDMRVDGNEQTESMAYTQGAIFDIQDGTAQFGLGALVNSTGGSLGYYLDGDIAEVLIYNRALTLVERQAVEDYLAAKYGL